MTWGSVKRLIGLYNSSLQHMPFNGYILNINYDLDKHFPVLLYQAKSTFIRDIKIPYWGGLCVMTVILLWMFVGSNQSYSLRRSFSESLKKFSFLFFTLLIASTWLETWPFLYYVYTYIFELASTWGAYLFKFNLCFIQINDIWMLLRITICSYQSFCENETWKFSNSGRLVQ